MVGYSLVRWWSNYLEFVQIGKPHIRTKLGQFLQTCINLQYAEKSCEDCLRFVLFAFGYLYISVYPRRILADSDFMLQLATMIDGGKILCDLTYRLEGDGFLAPFVYDDFQTVFIAPVVMKFPLLEQVLTEQGYVGQGRQNKFTELRDCILPAYQYLDDVFQNDQCLSSSLQLFNSCRWLLPTAAVVELDAASFCADVGSTHLLTNAELAQIQRELPVYLSLAHQIQGTMTPDDLFSLFEKKRDVMPVFFIFACRAALLQPSSATSERVFSILESVMKDLHGVLKDRICSTVMLRYNGKWRSK